MRFGETKIHKFSGMLSAGAFLLGGEDPPTSLHASITPLLRVYYHSELESRHRVNSFESGWFGSLGSVSSDPYFDPVFEF